ncbi:MAG: hypothetical protein EOO03_14030, partial [Chitinophagaceae bacterium]
MNRLQFLQNLVNRNSAEKANVFFSGIVPYSGQWTVNEVTHLLKRTMFGAKKTDIDHFLGMSMSDAVDELLNTVSTPAPPLRDYGLITTEDGTYDDLGVLLGQTWVNDPNMASDPDARPAISISL